jgi:putative transposase
MVVMDQFTRRIVGFAVRPGILDGIAVCRMFNDVPLSHPFVERLIATIRRELLDQVPFWTSTDLERKLSDFMRYYNRERTHRALGGKPPVPSAKAVADIHSVTWQRLCRGLCQLPFAA